MSGKKPWKTNWNQKQAEDGRAANRREQDKKQNGKAPEKNTPVDASLAQLSLEDKKPPPATEANPETTRTDGSGVETGSGGSSCSKLPASTTRSSVGGAWGAWGGSTTVARGNKPGGTVSTAGNGKASKPLQTSKSNVKARPSIPASFTAAASSLSGQKKLSEDEILRNYLKLRNTIDTSSDSPFGELCPRPGYGEKGRVIQVYANHFAVSAAKPFYLYTVVFEDSKPFEKRTQKIRLERLESVHPDLFQMTAMQGLQIVSPLRLENEASWPFKFTGSDDLSENQDNPESEKRYDGYVQFSKDIPIPMLLQHLAGSYTPGLDIEFMVQCLNIVLGDYPRSQRHLNPILNKYFQPNNPIPLDAGIVALKGFYSSVRPSAGQIQCNINVCTSAFLEGGNFAIVMTKIIRKYGTPNSLAKALPALNKLFKKCKVTHTYTGTRKTRTVYSIEQYTASTCTFQIKAIGGEGASGAGYVTTTVLQHFAQAYGLPLRYPDYPLVNVGTREKPINIPPELLEIEAGQRYKGMDPSLTEQMIKLACEGPQNNRERIIEEGLRTLGHHVNLNPAGLPLSTQFGISVSTNMALIPARVLPQPAILYGRKNVLKGSPSNTKSKGAWNLTSRSFLSCTALNMIEFTIFALNLSPLEGRNIRDWLMKPLLSECVRLGMTSQAMDVDRMKYKFVPTVAHGAPNTIRKEQIEQRFIEIASHPGKKMILVILPSKDRSEYALVKYLGDVRYGINTICIQNRHLAPKRRDMVPTLSRNLLGNIAMKVNFKLGGTNHMLYTTPTFLNGKVMIMGMDLTHASPGSLRGAPSIAGVVASCDSEYVNYPASLRLQTPKEDGQGEIISELKDMVRERLKCYQLTNKNALPTAILVYRDGVSEGEYLKMLNDEIPQIQEAWRKVKSELGTPAMTAQMVKITFVVVGKRHHTRFYPHNSKIPSSSTGPQENCLPGTTVDRGITSPYEYEWFSQSHKGLQGTTKPTHYVVLKDDNALSPDALQEITHNLCYTFARCTSAVSVCPPVYYADIVCERGRHYLDSIFCPSSADLKNAQVNIPPGTALEEVPVLKRMQLENIKKDTMDKARSIWGGGVHENLKKVMFYL